MDFDKFLERDIIEFLDGQVIQVAEKVAGYREEEFDLYEITQDYSKEINEALKAGDLVKARRVFEDVKNRYLKAPENSLSKKRFYIIMEEIFERIKDYEEKEEGKKSLFEMIKEYEKKGLFINPGLLQKKKAERTKLIMSIIAKKEEELEKLTSKEIVRGKDLKQAINEYRKIKALIKKIPNTFIREKAEAYESALGWYYTLRKLKQKLLATKKEGKKIKEIKEAKKEEPIEDRLARIRRLKEEIVKSHARIADYLKKRELERSIEEYRHLKRLCESFPHEMEEEKTALLADAISLYESIKKLEKSFAQRKSRELIIKKEDVEEREKREIMRREIRKRLSRIKEFLAEKNALNAIKEYNEVRRIFKDYPERPLEEKKKLYDEILETHKDVKLLEDDLKRKSSSHNLTKKNISDIDEIIEQVHNLLDKSMVEQATHKLLEAKHKIQLLPKEVFDEKYRLLREVERLEHKLIFVKNIQRINTPNIITA